jgi:hypothetical protein
MKSSVISTRIEKADMSIRYHNRAMIEITQNQTGGDVLSELSVASVSVAPSFTGITSGKTIVKRPQVDSQT